ncbi:MAG: penicillin acylase family protein [Amphiplicatus sp.]
MKVIGGILAAVCALLVIAGAVLWTPGPTRFDASAAKQAAAAFDARVIRDAFGVPHIYGPRDADVAFGLAYAHAEDDWKTIEETLFFSRGTLASQTGKRGAITDYLVAALNVWPDIEAQYERTLSPKTRELVEGYAAGINFWCAERPSRCKSGVAPVSGKDIVAGFVMRTPFFYGLDAELTALFETKPETHAALEQAREALLRLPPSVEVGSNAIAVAPSRATDGHTRLMVNSHQPYTGPVAWYEVRVKSEEGWDMIGGLFPGSPIVSHGAGPKLGWAFTVNKPDLVDVYKLEVDNPKKPTKYRFDGDWKPLERSKTKLRVRLFGPFSLPVTREVYRSAHGPVFVTPSGVFAVAYAAMNDIRGVEQFYRLNKASDFAEWRNAMAMQAVPSFNVVYADGKGTIAYYYNAAIPIRARDQDWSTPVPGDKSELLWQGVRPFGSAPHVVAPAAGYVVNGNNNPFESSSAEDSPKPEDFPPEYGIDMKTTNRGLREQELYGADEAISGEEFVAYKMDHFYSRKSRLAHLIDSLLADDSVTNDPGLAEEIALLKSWDLSASKDSRSAALAIRTGRLALDWYLAGEHPETPNPKDALTQASEELRAAFGRIDPLWSEAMRLKRGEESWALNGGPETLRAVYPDGENAHGAWTAAGGDTYILYADWPEGGGTPLIKTIHQFGSATLSKKSPHYADQAPLFAAEEWKSPPMTLDALLLEATADYRPGERAE